MGDLLKVKFKIGEIEFEAEGAPEDVEHQRFAFMDTLLPAAVDAMVRTRGVVTEKQYIEAQEIKSLPEENCDSPQKNVAPNTENLDMSVNEFLNSKLFSSQIDTALGLIYYNEKFKRRIDFSTDELKQYFKDAKITLPSNPSDVAAKLVGKSFIMEADEKNRYKLTRTGEKFIEAYVAKASKETKAKSRPKKTRAKPESVYSSLTADDLNLKKYPEIKGQKEFKNQMMLTLYIVFEEGHGDAFSVADVQCIMTDILGLPASKDQVQGVFSRNAIWFTDVQDENNKKSVKHRLLTGAKDFAKSIIDEASTK